MLLILKECPLFILPTMKAKHVVEEKSASGFATGSKTIVSPFTGGEIRVREHNGGLTRVGLSFGLPAGDGEFLPFLCEELLLGL